MERGKPFNPSTDQDAIVYAIYSFLNSFTDPLAFIIDSVIAQNDTSAEVLIREAVDFTDEAAKIVASLDRSSGFTKSSRKAGIAIHKGYKVGDNFILSYKEYREVPGIRPAYYDYDKKILYELKPNNPSSIRRGIRQLQLYNSLLGGNNKLILELY